MTEGGPRESRFLIDECALETRLAHLIDGRLVEVKYFRHGPPAETRARLGDVFLVRVAKSARGMSGYFVDLGEAGEGLLRTKDKLAEGAFEAATVTQCGYGTKLPVLARSSIEVPDSALKARRAHRVKKAPGAVGHAIAMAKPDEEILIDGTNALRETRAAMARAAHAARISLKEAPIGLFEREGIEERIEAALEPVVPLASGGRLIIEDTEALTTIDVDVAGAVRASDVNGEAAGRIPYEIALRRLAGTILIDCAQIRQAADLGRLKSRLAECARAIGLDLQFGIASRTGLLELQRSRGEAPLAAQLTVSGVTHTAVPVRLNLEAQAASLARGIRRANAKLPGALTARVGNALGDWLNGEIGRAAWQAIVAASPAPLHLEAEAGLNWGAFEVARSERGSP